MSMFLGPIHYWLYDKIGNQERLTAYIADKEIKRGRIQDAAPYIKELPELESVIDESNIHGWLQLQIRDAEYRYARLIGDIQKQGEDIAKLKLTAYDFGKDNAVNFDTGAAGIYQYFEDFFVNGMPCDHVNMIIEKDEEQVVWEMVQDIHAAYWENGNTAVYYELRKAVMDGMLEKTKYCITMSDYFHYLIQKK
ncbi:MAG: hypothetical protein ACTTKP_11340 [Catonella sp.]|uniref:hypothetical protein n=1 Tax=Catonella sp. TaxID=2382125 RepID=UPI003FA03C5D